MPTTYKVLGQTTTTAASASTIPNLILDPLVNVTSQSQANITTGQVVQAVTTGYTAGWRLMAESGASTNNFLTGVDIFGAGAANAAFSGTNSLWVNANSGSNGYQFGWSTGPATTDSTQTFAGTGNITVGPNAIPVSPSTTYYYGAYLNCSSTTGLNIQFRVKWYTSAGVYISASSGSVSPGFTANTWVKNSASATSPSTAAYAVFLIYGGMNNATSYGFDNAWFSAESASSTTFPTPTTGTTILTAPFNTRTTNVFSGTSNASTTVSTFAGALTDLYTVPVSTSTVASTLTLTNLGTTATTYRVLVLKSGETAAKKNFIAFDAPIGANSTDTFTLGMTLATGDKIQVASDSADVSATLFGSEIS
jgi:hypothetical protein